MNRLAENIIKTTARERGSTIERIKGRKRHPQLVAIRVSCMREIQLNTDLSLVEIGEIFDNRSRETILRLLRSGENKK